ncbi:MAG TPA: response regulator [Thermoanaerobaculia bacterium]|nr:response regulator [Thermoanaerobaculia bacterium]
MAEKKRALVVDDDDPIRMMLAKVVERQNLEVDTARDGLEAIQRIDANGYAVILLDLMMPKIDGYGVLKHLQAKHPDKLACTIIASAVPESEIMKHFNHPVFRIHAKPFDLAELIADIKECVAR